MSDVNSDGAGNVLAERLQRGEFVFTGEIVPPVSGGSKELLELAAPFKDRLSGLNVTDGPGARVHMSSLAASGILALNGHTPIVQLTCRDRNRIALQADLLGASALGVRNALFLTGDDPSAGDQPEAKAVFDAKSHDLLAWSRYDVEPTACLPSGRQITSQPQFFNGAADVPIDPPKDWIPAPNSYARRMPVPTSSRPSFVTTSRSSGPTRLRSPNSA